MTIAMRPSRIRVLIVDDHPIVRKGLEATIQPEPDMEVVAAAATGAAAVDLYREKKPDVTIMDLTLTKEMTGIQAIQAIRREFPEARILVLSAYNGDEDIFRALQAGAVTYLLKEALGDDLIPIIRAVHAGGGPLSAEVGRKLADHVKQPALTKREVEVLQLVAEGMRNKEIAAHLHISEETAQGHVKSILSKLNVHDRTEAVTVAIRRGILHIG
jgi:two-component system NarL family response regulator